MDAPSTIDDLLRLYEERGHAHYGESVSQIEHALQCAALATRDGAPDDLVAAALLHDVGHLVSEVSEATASDDNGDDHHELVGAHLLASLFATSVTGPIELHVIAKRWRCTTDPDYFDSLSSASKDSLSMQGGLLDPDECGYFETHPHFESALAVRSWDDRAKIEKLHPGSMRDYHDLLSRLAGAR